jgi:hypothetical protein
VLRYWKLSTIHTENAKELSPSHHQQPALADEHIVRCIDHREREQISGSTRGAECEPLI